MLQMKLFDGIMSQRPWCSCLNHGPSKPLSSFLKKRIVLIKYFVSILLHLKYFLLSYQYWPFVFNELNTYMVFRGMCVVYSLSLKFKNFTKSTKFKRGPVATICVILHTLDLCRLTKYGCFNSWPKYPPLCVPSPGNIAWKIFLETLMSPFPREHCRQKMMCLSTVFLTQFPHKCDLQKPAATQ